MKQVTITSKEGPLGTVNIPTNLPPDEEKSILMKGAEFLKSKMQSFRNEDDGSARVLEDIMDDTPDQPNLFERMIDKVFGHEGGYVNDPKDKGGATNFGVTRKTLSQHLGREATIDEVRKLDKKTAYDIYRSEYYLKPKINSLPKEFQAIVLDHGINAGPAVAIRMLQNMIGVEADGQIGPKTIERAQQYLEEKGVQNSVNDYVNRRKNFYQRAALVNPDNQRFLKGWLKRADSFLIT